MRSSNSRADPNVARLIGARSQLRTIFAPELDVRRVRRRRGVYMRSAALVLGAATGACASLLAKPEGHPWTVQERARVLERAQVWFPSNVAAADMKAGPAAADGFAPGATVTCDYVHKTQTGHSPKFLCAITPHDEVKVKYGRDNGEVYAEVAATRLLWALGFPTDRMYPVHVICRHCPGGLGGHKVADEAYEFDEAAIERKLPGRAVVLANREGWAWPELTEINEKAGGAPRAQREALTLLAALLQHTDSKSEQQRLLCLGDEMHGEPRVEGCRHPVAMINDLGLTFGRANQYNRNSIGSVNLEQWSRTRVWTDATQCVANIARSATGTLDHPRISEAGRQFLTNLLAQLSDGQLRDLFEVSRFDAKRVSPKGSGGIDAWVAAFKTKREQVAARRCDN